MRSVALVVVVMAFSVQGCAGALVYGESRKVTGNVLAPAVALVHPTVPQEAATTCIIKGMTVVEVLQLPNSARAKDAAEVQALVQEVSGRPGVADCLAAAGTVAG